jgi:hypothetical protein
MCSCSHCLPPTLRCDLGVRKMCGTSPPNAWDKPMLGPDTSAVSPFPAGPREGAGRSARSCSHSLPPTLRCDLGSPEGLPKWCPHGPPRSQILQKASRIAFESLLGAC